MCLCLNKLKILFGVYADDSRDHLGFFYKLIKISCRHFKLNIINVDDLFSSSMVRISKSFSFHF